MGGFIHTSGRHKTRMLVLGSVHVNAHKKYSAHPWGTSGTCTVKIKRERRPSAEERAAMRRVSVRTERDVSAGRHRDRRALLQMSLSPPDGWEVVCHQAPSSRYYIYVAPDGTRARSIKEAWRMHDNAVAAGGQACTECGKHYWIEGNEMLLCDGKGCENAFHVAVPHPAAAGSSRRQLVLPIVHAGDQACAKAALVIAVASCRGLSQRQAQPSWQAG